MKLYGIALLAIVLTPGLSQAQVNTPSTNNEVSVDAITTEKLITKPTTASSSKETANSEKEQPAQPSSHGKSIGYVPGSPIKPETPNLNFSKADRLYRQALRQKGTDTKAVISVIEGLKAALSVNPDHDKARLKLARKLISHSQPQQAMQWLKPLIHTENPDWQPWFWMGTAALQAGEKSVAGIMLDQALIREKGESAIWVQRAVVEQEKGAYETALQLLNTAVTLAPEDPVIMLNIAYSASAIEHLKPASEAYYKKYLEMIGKNSGGIN